MAPSRQKQRWRKNKHLKNIEECPELVSSEGGNDSSTKVKAEKGDGKTKLCNKQSRKRKHPCHIQNITSVNGEASASVTPDDSLVIIEPPPKPPVEIVTLYDDGMTPPKPPVETITLSDDGMTPPKVPCFQNLPQTVKDETDLKPPKMSETANLEMCAYLYCKRCNRKCNSKAELDVHYTRLCPLRPCFYKNGNRQNRPYRGNRKNNSRGGQNKWRRLQPTRKASVRNMSTQTEICRLINKNIQTQICKLVNTTSTQTEKISKRSSRK